MGIDVFIGLIAAVWLVLSFVSGQGGQALAWFSVIWYCAMNFTHHQLEGSKYDPRA